jgi:hypothetical protein
MLGAVWKRWDWLEDGLVPLSAILMHLAWTFPLFALFLRDPATGTVNSGFTVWLCLGILIGGAAAGRLASQNRMGTVIVVVGGLAAIWITLLFTVPADSSDLDSWSADILDHLRFGREGEAVPAPFVVGLCAILLWWRGVRIVTAVRNETVASFVTGMIALLGLLFLAALLPASPDEIPSRAARGLSSMIGPMAFLGSLVAALGFAVLSRYIGEFAMVLSQLSIAVGLLFLASILPVGPSAEALSGWIVLFCASGLTTLALHGVLDTLRQQAEKTGIRLRIDRYWAVTAFSVVASVLVVGLLVGQIVAPGTVARAFGWLRPVWTTLVRILLLLILVIAYLFFSLVGPILAGVQNRPSQARPNPFGSPLSPESLEEFTREPRQIPPIFGRILQAILVLGFIALLTWVFVRSVRRQERGSFAEDDVLETRETVLSSELVRSQLQGLLDSLRRARPPPAFVDPGGPDDPRRVIRELYQRLLARGIALDYPRPRSETPHSYQRGLSYVCSQARKDLEIVTAAYEAARYGVSPPTREQIEAAQEAFRRIDAVMQAAKKPRG